MTGKTKEYSSTARKLFEDLKCTEEQTLDIIEQALEDITLFDKKQHDYGPQNISKFGMLGVLVRSSDKLERLIHLPELYIKSFLHIDPKFLYHHFL